jgi:hypothetical protein
MQAKLWGTRREVCIEICRLVLDENGFGFGQSLEHSYGCDTQMLLSMQKLSKLKFSIEWSIGFSAGLVWTKGWDSLQNKWG